MNEPSYIAAYDTETEKYCMPEGVLIILRAESRMGVTVIQPIVNGAVTNYSIAQQMVKFLLIRLSVKAFSSQDIVAAISALSTDVEKKNACFCYHNCRCKGLFALLKRHFVLLLVQVLIRFFLPVCLLLISAAEQRIWQL